MNKLDYILNRVFNYFELNPETAFMKTRKSEIVKARQYFYYFARKHTDYSFDYIAKYLRQDHATVLHAIRKINGFVKIAYKEEIRIVLDLSEMFSKIKIENEYFASAQELNKMSDRALLRIERNIKLIKFMRENELK